MISTENKLMLKTREVTNNPAVAASRIIDLEQYVKMLSEVVLMVHADNDSHISSSDFFEMLYRFGRDREKESAAEFIIRRQKEAIDSIKNVS